VGVGIFGLDGTDLTDLNLIPQKNTLSGVLEHTTLLMEN